MKKNLISMMAAALALTACGSTEPAGDGFNGTPGEVKLLTLDPGHFHAALVQMYMYDEVDPMVHVYAPEGDDAQMHLDRVKIYNERSERPPSWQEVLYTGEDFLQKMIDEKKGNVVVLAGNNGKKTRYVKAAVDAVQMNPPCEIIAAAVISNPSEETSRLVVESKKKIAR